MLTKPAARLPLLEPLRNSLRVSLGVSCFIRRSRREDALFVTDVLLRKGRDTETALDALRRQKDWILIPEGRLIHLDPAPELWHRLIDSAPRCGVGRPEQYPEYPFLAACALRLVKEPVPADMQPVAPLRLTLKRLEAGELGRLQEELPPLAAVLQRKHSALPEAAGWYILSLRNH